MKLLGRPLLALLVLGLFRFSLLAQAAAPLSPAPGPGAATPPKIRPATYGTSTVSYVSVPAAEFFPRNSAGTYESDNSGQGPRWGTVDSVAFTTGLHLPAGAQPVYVELAFIDTNATQTVYASLVECDYFAANCSEHPAAGAGPGDCITNGYLCSGNAFAGGAQTVSADISSDGITVDNFEKQYLLYVVTSSTDGSLKFAGMNVGYLLQVSPPPAAATFNDVPTSDFGFQYIEALAASGITGGCGGGNYCPDSTVTRRQMAIFIAKALGLSFP